jgi:hypothetical protein
MGQDFVRAESLAYAKRRDYQTSLSRRVSQVLDLGVYRKLAGGTVAGSALPADLHWPRPATPIQFIFALQSAGAGAFPEATDNTTQRPLELPWCRLYSALSFEQL